MPRSLVINVRAETAEEKPLFRESVASARCVVLTTEANASMREVHPRMPLVLTKGQAASWLTEPGTAGKYLRMTPPLLERTAVDGQTCLW